MAYYKAKNCIIIFSHVSYIWTSQLAQYVVMDNGVQLEVADIEEFIEQYDKWINKNAQTSYKPRGEGRL